MREYRLLDEQNRERGFYFTMEEGEPIESHGFSYLHCRNMFKESGLVMGLDTLETLEQSYYERTTSSTGVKEE